MHVPARAKCECEALTESFERLIGCTKQQDNETSIDCTKRFEKPRDMVKSTANDDALDNFATNARECKEEQDVTKKG